MKGSFEKRRKVNMGKGSRIRREHEVEQQGAPKDSKKSGNAQKYMLRAVAVLIAVLVIAGAG